MVKHTQTIRQQIVDEVLFEKNLLTTEHVREISSRMSGNCLLTSFDVNHNY